ncbi:hypothetical protein JXL19_01695 [bacterium]|nr:hypothetical protein [bacterium]
MMNRRFHFFLAVFVTVVFAVILLSSPFTSSFACVGSRALALGGAFTGVADDTSATYWNPAGLARAGSGIVTMHTLNLRHEFNYDDYIGVSFSRRRWGIGLEYVGKSMQIERWRGDLSSKQIEGWEEDWLQIGGAFTWAYISFGLNMRYIYSENTKSIREYSYYKEEKDSGLALDFGVLAEFGPLFEQGTRRMFSAGMLIQNFNKPELLGQEHIANFRPGLGFRPVENLLFSLEIYDATRQCFHKPQIRTGLEWVISHPDLPGELALRGGLYHVNEYSYRAYTGGFGYLYPLSGKKALGFDYAFMMWIKTEIVVHLLSLVFRF